MTATLTQPTTRAEAVLDLDARMAARDAEMTLRLEEAALAHAVNTAHLPAVEIPHLPVDTAPATQVDEETPVTALLRRAQARILRDGWCRDAARTNGGAMCLAETIHAEAHSHADEGEARLLLSRHLGGDNIPSGNRRLRSAGEAAHVLGRAADEAAARGL